MTEDEKGFDFPLPLRPPSPRARRRNNCAPSKRPPRRQLSKANVEVTFFHKYYVVVKSLQL
ncbi:MAG: hypothetical protein C5B49_06265 [Bdellovibrio sp.]|nr:MAG: hypothetical protein C5B49_06265 [Bdellovibrio sp.]